MALGSYKSYFYTVLCFLHLVFFPVVYTKAEIKFLCIRLEFNAAFIFLASQGLNSVTKAPMVAVVPPYLSFLIRTFLLVPISLCTAIRFISLNHQKSPLPKKCFVCSCFSLLKWCGTGSGAIAPPGTGMGWVCSSQQAGRLRPWWSYQSHWMK